jgi:hypothetical protein
MRNYETFRRRFFAAIGALSASTAVACESSTAGSEAGDTSAASDTGATEDVLAADDAIVAEDTSLADIPGAVDVPSPDDVPLIGEDVTLADVAAEDIALADTSGDDVPVAPDIALADTSHDGGPAGDVVPAEDVGGPDVSGDLCGGGSSATTCYSAEALKYNIENPPFGGKPGAVPMAYDGPLPPEGCPDPSLVQDGCCNPGVGVAQLVGDECCYVHCNGACCGRPLEVDGVRRVAGLERRRDWLLPERVSASTLLDDHARRALAAAWREDARDEHAAIASFQRFGLDLLSVGAPPELVADATRAVMDEIGHARFAFRLAADLDGSGEGPGALDCSGLVVSADLTAAAVAAAREGCVGETLAAVALGAAARNCPEPSLSAQLQAIADDEARHAELAWRFVSWAISTGGDAVRSAVAHAFAHELAAGPGEDPRETLLGGVTDAQRALAGRLSQRDSETLRRRTLVEIVAPSVQELFGASRLQPTAVAAAGHAHV